MQTLDELNAQIAATLEPIARTETVALDDACGRVLAEVITSNIELPVADVSAMDGYAFTANSGDTLTLIGESIAGRPFAGTVGAGECVRIMTGAVVPAGADTVEMQENTTRDGDRITLNRATPPRANIRYRGEELTRGETVLQPGKILGAADVLLCGGAVIYALFSREKNGAKFCRGARNGAGCGGVKGCGVVQIAAARKCAVCAVLLRFYLHHLRFKRARLSVFKAGFIPAFFVGVIRGGRRRR